MKQLEIKFLSNNEMKFVSWYKKPFEDYWKSNLTGSNLIHHYIFKIKDNYFHISFSTMSIVLGKITDMEKEKETLIYKGYKWEYCLKVLNKYE